MIPTAAPALTDLLVTQPSSEFVFVAVLPLDRAQDALLLLSLSFHELRRKWEW